MLPLQECQNPLHSGHKTSNSQHEIRIAFSLVQRNYSLTSSLTSDIYRARHVQQQHGHSHLKAAQRGGERPTKATAKCFGRRRKRWKRLTARKFACR